MMNITLTESALAKIADLLAEHGSAAMLRVFVQGGGCSGFQYGFAFEDEVAEDDEVSVQGEARIVVDAISGQYLVGACIDYVEELMGAHFSITNPNASSTCGCGSSFSV